MSRGLLALYRESHQTFKLTLYHASSRVAPKELVLQKMVNPSVPNDYALSPAEATPHLTINHDVAADLDSTNAFEGNTAQAK